LGVFFLIYYFRLICLNIWTTVRLNSWKTNRSPSRYMYIAVRMTLSILRNTYYSILLPTLDIMVTFFRSPKLRCLILVGFSLGNLDRIALDYNLVFRKYWTQDYDTNFYVVDEGTLESGELFFLEGEYHMVWSKSETASFASPYFSKPAIMNRLRLRLL
jgi:hypothetical protein